MIDSFWVRNLSMTNAAEEIASRGNNVSEDEYNDICYKNGIYLDEIGKSGRQEMDNLVDSYKPF